MCRYIIKYHIKTEINDTLSETAVQTIISNPRVVCVSTVFRIDRYGGNYVYDRPIFRIDQWNSTTNLKKKIIIKSFQGYR